MTSRERLRALFSGETADRFGFWMGNPHPQTLSIYLEHFGVGSEEELRLTLKDDMRWICPEWDSYRHPDGKQIFDIGEPKPGSFILADCEDPSELEDYDWPNPDYLDFSETLSKLRNSGNHWRASGMWCAFFHIVAGLFGMENYFIKMHSNPDVVDAVTERVCAFYYEANKRFFDLAGDDMDAFFMGNDFGTQLDLLISPEMFDRFILPWVKEFASLARSRGYIVMHHSCGAIHKIIGRLISVGVDVLHPLQAKAKGMDAETLARDFKGKIAFLGGIDTQELLVNGTPEQVREEVRRIKRFLGPNLVVSPSHEALLPNVPPENVLAMAEEAVLG